MDELDGFDPLRDAVVFGDTSVKLNVLKTVKIRMMGEDFSLHPGETEVPEYLAVFMVARGMATV